MKAIALQSGSNGNCVFVESGKTRLLIDAGISGKQAQTRLASLGRDIRDVDAMLLTHDHRDHARCAGIYQRKFGLAMLVTERTLAAANQRHALGKLGELQHFRRGESLQIGEITVETIPTPHDGADGAAFVLDDGRCRLGVLTDLGHVFDDLGPMIATLDAVILESNYDPQMLAQGPYPAFLKRRIAGAGGHISNLEAAELVGRYASDSLRWLCLGHLSQDNNTPTLAMETHRQVLGNKLAITVASRHRATDVMEI